MCPQNNAFGGNDITQLASFCLFDLDIPFLDQPLHVPVDRTHSHTQPSCKGRLGGIRLGLNLFQNSQVSFEMLHFNLFNIQLLNYKLRWEVGQADLDEKKTVFSILLEQLGQGGIYSVYNTYN